MRIDLFVVRTMMSRVVRISVLLAWLCGATWSAWGQSGKYDWSSVKAEYPGIKLAEIRVETPRPMDVFCLQVDLTTPGLRFRNSDRASDWVAGQRETIRETTRDFLIRCRKAGLPMVFAINANFFAPWPAPWNAATPSYLIGLAITDGDVVSPAESVTYSLVFYNDNKAAILATGPTTPLENIHTAVSGYRCLDAGNPDASSSDLAPRTGAGVSQDGRVVYLLVIDGRRHASQGATIQEVGAWLKHFGAWNGINLDGGGSTTLVRWVPGRRQAQLVNRPVGTGQNWLKLPVGVEQLVFEPTERYNGNNLGVVVPHLDVVSAPGDLTLEENACHTLEVRITGAQGPVFYAWFKDGKPLPGGQDQPSLKLCPVTLENAGVYECEIKDSLMTIRTAPSRVTVTPKQSAP